MKEKISLNANYLKLIAIIAMTIDHATDLIAPNFSNELYAIALHVIGRLTAPIMWFFVCEGLHYTHDIKKYMLRMGIFAIISHFAYCFAFGISFIPFKDGIFNQTSVMYPLFIAVVVHWLESDEVKLNIVLKRIIIFVLIWSAFVADWSSIAVLAILGMYKKRGNVEKQMLVMIIWVALYGIVSWFFVSKTYALVLLGVLLVYPVLKLYNGEKGKCNWMKWFFYIYYPFHLIIVGIIRLCVYGNISLLNF
ncbi:MAG: conjugal transfer protein TraX [Treponema sp.]|nr:conjugal transfer protein TraX [Candidatus Treponema scatequi]